LRQDQFAFENFTVIDTVIMGHTQLWAVKQAKTRKGEWVPFEVKAGGNDRAPPLSRDQQKGADAYAQSQLDRAMSADYRSWKSVDESVSQRATRISNEMLAAGFSRYRGYVVKVNYANVPARTSTTIYAWTRGVK
jgi:hypothetical protein